MVKITEGVRKGGGREGVKQEEERGVLEITEGVRKGGERGGGCETGGGEGVLEITEGVRKGGERGGGVKQEEERGWWR